MAWLLLFSAIVLEVLAMVQLKLSEGFSKPEFSFWTIALFILSFVCATFAFKKIDIGLAYALWSGLGTVGIVCVGFFYFNETATMMKLCCMLLIVVGIIGLNLSS
jgi:multidrug transporter EmrE-like cation transporter